MVSAQEYQEKRNEEQSKFSHRLSMKMDLIRQRYAHRPLQEATIERLAKTQITLEDENAEEQHEHVFLHEQNEKRLGGENLQHSLKVEELAKRILDAHPQLRQKVADEEVTDETSVNWRDPENHLRTRLHEAVYEGDLNLVKRLLKCGASINILDAGGNTAFQLAVRQEHKKIIKLLGAV